MKNIALFISFIILSKNMEAQNTVNTFDFWIGKWNASWSDSIQGQNIIEKNLNNHVIVENFKFNNQTFNGKSWSVFDSIGNIWHQTWVDDSGAYILFTGGQEGDKIILTMTEKRNNNGKIVTMRMVFYNINENSFDWDWQSSADEVEWKSVWNIHYTRIK
jgi:hypothetical protein